MLRPSSAAVATIFGNGQTRLKELFELWAKVGDGVKG